MPPAESKSIKKLKKDVLELESYVKKLKGFLKKDLQWKKEVTFDVRRLLREVRPNDPPDVTPTPPVKPPS